MLEAYEAYGDYTSMHTVAAWAELGDEVAVKRDIIRLVADIRLKPAGKGNRRPFGRHRLEWRWKFGPEYDDTGSMTPLA